MEIYLVVHFKSFLWCKEEVSLLQLVCIIWPVHVGCLVVLVPVHSPGLTQATVLDLLETNLIVAKETILTGVWALKL